MKPGRHVTLADLRAARACMSGLRYFYMRFGDELFVTEDHADDANQFTDWIGHFLSRRVLAQLLADDRTRWEARAAVLGIAPLDMPDAEAAQLRRVQVRAVLAAFIEAGR